MPSSLAPVHYARGAGDRLLLVLFGILPRYRHTPASHFDAVFYYTATGAAKVQYEYDFIQQNGT